MGAQVPGVTWATPGARSAAADVAGSATQSTRKRTASKSHPADTAGMRRKGTPAARSHLQQDTGDRMGGTGGRVSPVVPPNLGRSQGVAAVGFPAVPAQQQGPVDIWQVMKQAGETGDRFNVGTVAEVIALRGSRSVLVPGKNGEQEVLDPDMFVLFLFWNSDMVAIREKLSWAFAHDFVDSIRCGKRSPGKSGEEPPDFLSDSPEPRRVVSPSPRGGDLATQSPSASPPRAAAQGDAVRSKDWPPDSPQTAPSSSLDDDADDFPFEVPDEEHPRFAGRRNRANIMRIDLLRRQAMTWRVFRTVYGEQDGFQRWIRSPDATVPHDRSARERSTTHFKYDWTTGRLALKSEFEARYGLDEGNKRWKAAPECDDPRAEWTRQKERAVRKVNPSIQAGPAEDWSDAATDDEEEEEAGSDGHEGLDAASSDAPGAAAAAAGACS
eukprot:TRINITY_DN25977_c0_g4_i1.p1 TRINITY_DN25977_c0_g4~~TRINITY_DN25977_c0_g4_i1.p1  ORF type:complete len:464 (+),score=68.07 TRINITY_DN25977_c0_g4_i1:74-1393(+)